MQEEELSKTKATRRREYLQSKYDDLSRGRTDLREQELIYHDCHLARIQLAIDRQTEWIAKYEAAQQRVTLGVLKLMNLA